MQLIYWNFLLIGLTFGYGTTALDITQATVSSIQASISSGEETCRSVIEKFLNRIDQFNRQGPELGAVTMVNPGALQEADSLDRIYQSNGNRFAGTLHCTPLLVKDNIDVAGLPTTAGFNIFKDQIPLKDAQVVSNARQNGAVLLGKANMSPQADKEAWGNSETGGLIRNPFGPNFTTYGSSGGNGAAGAAMLTVLGFGTETGVSVNLPSSAANLVGLRAPVAMISQEGVFPNSKFQDTVGPMAKRVQDVAIALDTMIDRSTSMYPYSSQAVLKKDGLQGMKMNIFNLFAYQEMDIPGKGYYKVDPQIQALFSQMVLNMQGAGAVVQNKTIDMSVAMPATMGMFIAGTEGCNVLWRDSYMSDKTRFGPNVPYHSVAEVVQSGKLPEYYQKVYQQNLADSANCQEQSDKYVAARQNFINSMITPLLEDADIAFWPAMPEFPPMLGQDAFDRDWGSDSQPPVNMILAGSWSAYTTLDLPMGFSQPFPGAPDGLPIGAILLAKPENLDKLLTAAYAYQENFGNTKLPFSVRDVGAPSTDPGTTVPYTTGTTQGTEAPYTFGTTQGGEAPTTAAVNPGTGGGSNGAGSQGDLLKSMIQKVIECLRATFNL